MLRPLSVHLRRAARRTLVLIALWLLAAAGCGDRAAFHFEGSGGVPTPVTFSSDVPLVWVGVETASPQPFLLDTGSPLTLLSSDAFDRAPGVARIDRLALLGITVRGHTVAVDRLFGGGFSVAGVLGGDILTHFALGLDYQGGQAALWPESPAAEVPLPADTVEPVAHLPFSLAGGGAVRLSSGDTLRVGATRVLLGMDVEGQAVLAVVDTGASLCVVSPALYDEILARAPDRPRLHGLPVATLQGTAPAEISRVASLGALAVAPTGDSPPADATPLPATRIPSVAVLALPEGSAFDLLSEEVGAPVSLLVGASYLRHFQITVDYPARTLRLARYRSLSHIDPDEWVGVGFTWDRAPSGEVLVEAVLPDTSAATAGVLPGDAIWRAGSHDIRQEGPAGVQAALDASDLGDRVPFEFGRDGRSVQIAVEIEDLLPPFESRRGLPRPAF